MAREEWVLVTYSSVQTLWFELEAASSMVEPGTFGCPAFPVGRDTDPLTKYRALLVTKRAGGPVYFNQTIELDSTVRFEVGLQ